MIPRVAKPGRSFKGAGLYYLHDKKASTAHRVGWTHTLNMATDDPDQAIRQMAGTAMNANYLKQKAGVKASGRQLKNPVYVYSLSWHESDRPTDTEILKSAVISLQALGMQEHQALLVKHIDTDHPHVHVIVNRVHPETGKAASYSNDRVTLSNFAQEHDRLHGRDHCPKRRENNTERAKGSYVRHSKEDWRLYHYVRGETLKSDHKAARERLWDGQKPILDQAFSDMKRKKAAIKAQLRERYKPQWAALYREQRTRTKNLSSLTRTMVGRARILSNGRLRSQLGLRGRDIFRPRRIMRALESHHERERGQLKAQVSKAHETALSPLDGEYRAVRDRLKAERQSQRAQQFEENKAIWVEAKTPEKRQEFDQAVKQAAREKRTLRQRLVDTMGQDAVLRAEKRAAEKDKKRQEQKSNKNDPGRTRDR